MMNADGAPTSNPTGNDPFMMSRFYYKIILSVSSSLHFVMMLVSVSKNNSSVSDKASSIRLGKDFVFRQVTWSPAE